MEKIPDDILKEIISMLNFKDRNVFFGLNKYFNGFATDKYFKYEIVAANIPILYLTKNSNTLNTLILLHDIIISDKILKHLSKLRHLELPKNTIITDIGLSYIPLVTNLNLDCNKNITV